MRCALFLGLLAPLVASAADPTVFFELGSQKLEAKLLAQGADRLFVLARDGKMWDFAPTDAKNVRRIADNFTPLAAGELRSQLQREFGKRFDVGGGGNYVVVYPAGEKNLWANRFDELDRSFRHYFAARGFRPDAARFPLVAIVFPTRDEFVRYTIADGHQDKVGLLGYYSAKTNRIALYDSSKSAADWTANAETIIHEAAHQTAFNSGIHSRLSGTPGWVVEGLGCLFEAPGVYNSSRYPQRVDRLNRDRLASFHRYAAGRRKPGALAEFVTTDRMFETDADAAYAEAWAFTFFLSETEPKKWIDYLRKTAELKPLVAYRSPERLRDFTAIFGQDLRMLETRFLRFMDELR